jgi:hypothetical protein
MYILFVRIVDQCTENRLTVDLVGCLRCFACGALAFPGLSRSALPLLSKKGGLEVPGTEEFQYQATPAGSQAKSQLADLD